MEVVEHQLLLPLPLRQGNPLDRVAPVTALVREAWEAKYPDLFFTFAQNYDSPYLFWPLLGASPSKGAAMDRPSGTSWAGIGWAQVYSGPETHKIPQNYIFLPFCHVIRCKNSQKSYKLP